MTSRRPFLKAGDLFEMDCGESGFGYGQIIVPGDVFFASVLRPLFATRQDVASLDINDTLGFARTTDGCLYRGEWTVIGHRNLPRVTPLPRYKVGTAGGMVIAEFDDSIVRQASAQDVAFYDFKRSVSSPLLQEFLLAHHGRGIREPDQRLYVDYLMARSPGH